MPHFHVKNDTEYKEILSTNPDKVIFVKASAKWCGPCKMIAPHFARHAGEHDNAVFVSVDVEECPDTAAELQVSAMPTFFAFKGGELQETFSGANRNKLDDLVKKYTNYTN